MSGNRSPVWALEVHNFKLSMSLSIELVEGVKTQRIFFNHYLRDYLSRMGIFTCNNSPRITCIVTPLWPWTFLFDAHSLQIR